MITLPRFCRLSLDIVCESLDSITYRVPATLSARDRLFLTLAVGRAGGSFNG